jgi:predicted anti-sigma-YlaC factor YlaD
VRDHCHVNCTHCRKALSARLDGEDSEAERDTVDAHLATCTCCQAFADAAAHVTRLTRTTVAIRDPDVVAAVLAAAPRSRRRQLITAARVLLGLVGLAQVELALVDLVGAHNSDHGGVVLQGASVAHFAHESAAWNLALGVGFLWVAYRSSRPSGMVPTVATFVAVLIVLVVMDTMAGGVDAARLLGHSLVVLGLVLVIMLDRLRGPTGGTVPGTPSWRQRRVPQAQRVTDTTSDIPFPPPDLRPTAQYRRTA